MDLLQVALVFLILLLSVFLTILGIQVFFILKNLRQALDKFEKTLENVEVITEGLEKPVRAVAEVTSAIQNGVKIVKAMTEKTPKPSRRFFLKRR